MKVLPFDFDDEKIKIHSWRYDEIKSIISDLFDEHQIKCIPVSAFELAKKMRVQLTEYSIPNEYKFKWALEISEDGFCVENKNGIWSIYYNDNNNYQRINFTISHELGHIVLDHSQDSELADLEANFFAKYMLAPPI